jgi:hypothetical protein
MDLTKTAAEASYHMLGEISGADRCERKSASLGVTRGPCAAPGPCRDSVGILLELVNPDLVGTRTRAVHH